MLGLPLTSVSVSCSGVSLSSTHSRMMGERTDVTMPLVISQTVFWMSLASSAEYCVAARASGTSISTPRSLMRSLT